MLASPRINVSKRQGANALKSEVHISHQTLTPEGDWGEGSRGGVTWPFLPPLGTRLPPADSVGEGKPSPCFSPAPFSFSSAWILSRHPHDPVATSSNFPSGRRSARATRLGPSSFECVSFSCRTKVGARAWQRGGRKVHGVCGAKHTHTHTHNDPRERERGKHQSSGRWAFSTFPLKRKKKFFKL